MHSARYVRYIRQSLFEAAMCATVVLGSAIDQVGIAGIVTEEQPNFVLRGKQVPDDADRDDQFGQAVVMSHDLLVVGAIQDEDAGVNAGAAYVFRRNEESWSQEQKLTASDTASGSMLRIVALADTAPAVWQPSQGLSAVPVWVAEGNQANARFGVPLAPAGDVNGDGYADVIIGATTYSNGQSQEGRAYVYLGSPSGLATSPAWIAESDRANALFGTVSTAGDVNGDGYDDVIVGAWGYANGEAGEGAAYVYLGSASGLAASPACVLESNQANAQFGVSVATAGDVNGDGYDDVIVGARYYDNGQDGEGGAFVYLGSATGLAASPAWTAESNQVGAHFGERVVTAGDVNGDGYDDVLVGAFDYDNGEMSEGAAFLYLGSATGPATISAWTAEGNEYGALFGSVASAGDVNGDGYSDVVVGAVYYDGFPSNNYNFGGVFVYFGSASGLPSSPSWTATGRGGQFGWSVTTAGDVNDDGYSDLVVGANTYNSNYGRAYIYYGSPAGLPYSHAWIADGDQMSAQFGVWVATAGDVNHDGYSDVLVGANLYTNGQEKEGRAYLYSGAPSSCFPPTDPIRITTMARNAQGSVTLHFQDSNHPTQVTGYNIHQADVAWPPPAIWFRIGTNVNDIDGTMPGVQWMDPSAPLSPGEIRYYQVKAYNSLCDAEGPP